MHIKFYGKTYVISKTCFVTVLKHYSEQQNILGSCLNRFDWNLQIGFELNQKNRKEKGKGIKEIGKGRGDPIRPSCQIGPRPTRSQTQKVSPLPLSSADRRTPPIRSPFLSLTALARLSASSSSRQDSSPSTAVTSTVDWRPLSEPYPLQHVTLPYKTPMQPPLPPFLILFPLVIDRSWTKDHCPLPETSTRNRRAACPFWARQPRHWGRLDPLHDPGRMLPHHWPHSRQSVRAQIFTARHLRSSQTTSLSEETIDQLDHVIDFVSSRRISSSTPLSLGAARSSPLSSSWPHLTVDLNGNLAGQALFSPSSANRLIWIQRVKLVHLNEQAPTDLEHPLLFESNGLYS
jgi:hypothetical protein